jgi:hypothetical protein
VTRSTHSSKRGSWVIHGLGLSRILSLCGLHPRIGSMTTQRSKSSYLPSPGLSRHSVELEHNRRESDDLAYTAHHLQQKPVALAPRVSVVRESALEDRKVPLWSLLACFAHVGVPCP